MSRPSHLELLAAGLQVLGPVDSVSLPSEPADIKNWFPSYIYESPGLDTLDGFQDSVEEEKKGKSRRNRNLSTFDDGMLAAAKDSADAMVNCNERDKCESSKSVAVVMGFSESHSFSLEPPDVNNKFLSYFYESPPLDGTNELTISDYKDLKDGKSFNAHKSFGQGNKDSVDFIDVEESTKLHSQSRISDVVVKHGNLVQDAKLELVCKDGHYVDLKFVSSILGQSTSVMVEEKMLAGLEKGIHNHGSVEKSGAANVYEGDNDTKLEYSSVERTKHRNFHMENNTYSWDEKSYQKSIGRNESIKESLRKESPYDVVSSGTLGLAMLKGDSWRGCTEIAKENEGIELPLNGFISTRKKSRQSNTGKMIGASHVHLEPLKTGVNRELNCEKEAKISRKVFADKSNFHSPNALESTEKWLCPRKNKSNLGPPLKQLRLEHWVYRA